MRVENGEYFSKLLESIAVGDEIVDETGAACQKIPFAKVLNASKILQLKFKAKKEKVRHQYIYRCDLAGTAAKLHSKWIS